MTQPLRTAHRRVMILLAVLLPATFHEKTTSCQQKNTLQCWTSRFPAPPKVRDTLPLRIQSGL